MGDVTVDMDSTSGDITAETFTVATVVSKATVTNVPDAGTDELELITIKNTNQTASDIVIREASAGVAANGTHKFTLTFSEEVSWNVSMDKTKIYSNMKNGDADVKIDSTNNRVLTVEFTASTSNGLRRTFTISPVVDTTKNAKEGDLTVTLRGIDGDISDASNLVIGKIGQADVSVYVDEEDYSEDEIPALYFGLDVDVNQDANDYYQDDVAIITIKENKAGNLSAGKYIDFTFDPQVQLLGNVMVDTNGKSAKKGPNTISFEIDAESVDKASTITISGLEIILTRNPAEGGYDTKTYGDAAINNGAYNDNAFADTYVS